VREINFSFLPKYFHFPCEKVSPCFIDFDVKYCILKKTIRNLVTGSNLVSPSGMVETPHLEAREDSVGGNGCVDNSFFENNITIIGNG
jgi:hypothetical protein